MQIQLENGTFPTLGWSLLWPPEKNRKFRNSAHDTAAVSDTLPRMLSTTHSGAWKSLPRSHSTKASYSKAATTSSKWTTNGLNKIAPARPSHNSSWARSTLTTYKRQYTSDQAIHMPSAQATLDKLQPTMDRLTKEHYIKGLAAAVIVDGQVTYKQYGHFNIGIEAISEEASKEHVFEIGSITKPITGIALASMLEEGKLKPTDKLSSAMSRIKKDAAVGSRTIGQLATHTSGLPRLSSDFLSRVTEVDPYSKYTDTDLINNSNALDDLKAADTNWEYSNLGYGLLGLAMTEAHSSTATYDSMMKERVFNPLGMTNTATTTRVTTTGHNEEMHTEGEWNFQSFKGAGALRSTPNDMIKLLTALANPSESPLRGAIERSLELASGPGIPPHGLGWMLTMGENKDIFWHNGSTAGYHCFIGVHRPSKRGVLLMSNTASNTVSRCGANMLMNLIGVDKQLTLHNYCPDEIYEELMREYTGLYRFKGGLHFKVTLKRGKLYLQITGHPAVQIHPETPFLWHIRSNGATVEFDGTEWESGLPPHTLIYKDAETTCHATRDGQEFRKFMIRTKHTVSSLFKRGEKQ